MVQSPGALPASWLAGGGNYAQAVARYGGGRPPSPGMPSILAPSPLMPGQQHAAAHVPSRPTSPLVPPASNRSATDSTEFSALRTERDIARATMRAAQAESEKLREDLRRLQGQTPAAPPPAAPPPAAPPPAAPIPTAPTAARIIHRPDGTPFAAEPLVAHRWVKDLPPHHAYKMDGYEVYAINKKQKGLRRKKTTTSAKEQELLDKAIADTLPTRDASFKLDEAQRLNAVRYAMETGKRGHARKDGFKPYDVSELGRQAANGNMMPTWEVYNITSRLQQENEHLAMELRHVRGWDTMGTTSSKSFIAPSRFRTKKQNEQSRRLMKRVLPLQLRTREILGGQEGMDEYHAYKLDAGAPGSGCWSKNQVIRSAKVIQKAAAPEMAVAAMATVAILASLAMCRVLDAQGFVALAGFLHPDAARALTRAVLALEASTGFYSTEQHGLFLTDSDDTSALPEQHPRQAICSAGVPFFGTCETNKEPCARRRTKSGRDRGRGAGLELALTCV